MSDDSKNQGHLVLVATPIGNLQDITLRALETLREADVVACEDTRTTRVLLNKHGIQARVVAFHAHNENHAASGLLALLKSGKTVALVSDAGTPGIADPGYSMVKTALENGIPCTMTPGPSAMVMALALSGLPSHSFTFRGFPPRKSAARKRFFELDLHSTHTLIFYESVHRLSASLADALAVYGDRRAALAKELTKRFEHIERGTLSALLQMVGSQTPHGEFVLLIEGAEACSKSSEFVAAPCEISLPYSSPVGRESEE